MSRIPERATHAADGTYYRQAGRSAYVWCRTQHRWVYMEDASARKALRRATPLSSYSSTHEYRIAREGKAHE